VFLLLLVFNSQFRSESRIDEYEEYNDDFLVKHVTLKSKKKTKQTQNKFSLFLVLWIKDISRLFSLLLSLSFSFSSFFYHDRQRDKAR
jgi:hypothetical protein